MQHPLTRFAVAAFTALLATTPAQAAVRTFTGAAHNIGSPPVPDPACSPLLKTQFGPSATGGVSSFGDFTYTQAHCTTGGPGPYSGGQFQYFFAAGDMFSGTYSGVAAPSGNPSPGQN